MEPPHMSEQHQRTNKQKQTNYTPRPPAPAPLSQPPSPSNSKKQQNREEMSLLINCLLQRQRDLTSRPRTYFFFFRSCGWQNPLRILVLERRRQACTHTHTQTHESPVTWKHVSQTPSYMMPQQHSGKPRVHIPCPLLADCVTSDKSLGSWESQFPCV